MHFKFAESWEAQVNLQQEFWVMSINYVGENGRIYTGLPRRMRTLMAINAALAASVLLAWTFVAMVFEKPVEWATWARVYRGTDLVSLTYYPFVALWLAPLTGIAIAWLAIKCGRQSLAYSSVLLPIAMLSLVIGMYYVIPVEMR